MTTCYRTEPIDPQTTMFQSTIYARHERRRLNREATQRQRRQGGAPSHDAHDGRIVSRSALGEVSPPAMASASASAETFAATTSSMDVPSSSSVSSTAHLPLSMDLSSATSISYSDDEPLASANPSYEHHRHHQPQSYTKGSTLLLAASAAATSAWILSRTAQGARPLHAPFLSASGTTTTTPATAGTRQVVLLAGACVAAGGHCCPISSPFRAGAGLPVAVKMSVLGAMSFFVGGRYASRVHRHQHH